MRGDFKPRVFKTTLGEMFPKMGFRLAFWGRFSGPRPERPRPDPGTPLGGEGRCSPPFFLGAPKPPPG